MKKSTHKTTDSIPQTNVNPEFPTHVAIIMDGNGRWAKERKFGRIRGHRAGIKSIKEVVKTATNLGIKYLTLYAFSTENWNRPTNEINALWNLLVEFLKKEVPVLIEKDVKLSAIGRIRDIPPFAQRELNYWIDKSQNCQGLTLILALNYGGRTEIVDAFRNILEKEKPGPEEINEKLIDKYLYTSDIPDPDLMIRTSGEKRISNFLLWQVSYAELVFSDTLWPDFREEHFLEAVKEFQSRQRRFGGV